MTEIETLPLWRQRLLAGALLLGLVVAIAILADSLVGRHVARVHDLEEQRHLLGQFLAVAARRDGLERAVADVDPVEVSASRWYLAGLSPDLAAAQVQAMAKQVAAAAGATVHSAQTVDRAEGGAVRHVSVDLVLTVPMEGLVELVHGLETLEPLVFIDRLVANPRQHGRAAVPRDIHMRLRVFALLDPGTEGEPS